MAKILAIDDKHDNLIVISALLKDLIPGCNIITAQSGASGIEKAINEQPDTILLDVRMPEMDGYEVCKRLKSDTQTGHIPVIMLTAVEKSSSSRVKGLESGADAFMTKPVDETELVAQVKVTLRIKKAEDQLREEKYLLENLVEERTKELSESEKRLRTLVENSLTGISIIQDEGVGYQNPEQERLLGPLPRSPKYTDIENIHSEDVEKVKDFHKKMNSGDMETVEMDFRFYSRDHPGGKPEMKWVSCRASRIEYQGKEAVLMNMMDITRIRELEHLLMIQDKMTSLGHVAAGIAHEIRNPLSGINIYLDTMRRLFDSGEGLDKVSGIIERVKKESSKIESVIRRVIDFSKPTAPEFVLANINNSVEETISLSAVTLRKSQIFIEKKLDDKLPLCNIDIQLMEQVILNLITNAADSMKEIEGNRRIELSTSFENEDIVIKVSDSGPGIPDEIKYKIFDPFYTTKKGSTGIGLSLCHRIISDHGGFLDVAKSQLGGADFIIRIPMRKGI